MTEQGNAINGVQEISTGNWFSEIFRDDNGNMSSARVIRFITNLFILAVWVYVSVRNHELEEISWQVMLFGLGSNAVPMVQRHFENQTPK